MSYKKFTQQEVADKLNISRQSISKWGNGSSTPDIANLIVLASFYKISIQDLTKENKQLKEKISRNNETIHTQQQKLANIRKVLSTSKNNDSWFLLIILLFTFVFAPLNFTILPLVFMKNKKSNQLYKLILILSFISTAFTCFVFYGWLSDVFNFGGTITIEQSIFCYLLSL